MAKKTKKTKKRFFHVFFNPARRFKHPWLGAVEVGQRWQAVENAPVLSGPKQNRKQIGTLSQGEVICVIEHFYWQRHFYVHFNTGKGLRGGTALKSSTGVDMLAFLPSKTTAANPMAQASFSTGAPPQGTSFAAYTMAQAAQAQAQA
jgi:hypothetical protein